MGKEREHPLFPIVGRLLKEIYGSSVNPFLSRYWQQTKADGAILGAVVSFCVSVAALSVSLLNRRRDKIKNTMTYLDEWRTPTFTADRDFTTREVSTRLTPSYVQKAYSGISKEESGRIRHVSHYLEYLGTMMKNGHVDEELILEQIGEPVEQLWMILGHFLGRSGPRRPRELTSLH